MARTIVEQGRIGTVRSGRDKDGAIKNGKVLVWGHIDVTSYTTGGETVAPKDIGLSTIDFITFDVRTVNDADTPPSDGVTFGANYIQSSNKVIIDVALKTGTQVTSTQDAELYYFAGGDAAVADLT